MASDDFVFAQEQRQQQRYDVEEGALLVYDQHADREIGFVKDIGPGGLSFEYFDVGAPMTETGEIGLLVWDSQFFIGKIPYRIVSDFELDVDDHSPVAIRHCSIQFEVLETEKHREIESFISFFSEERPH